LFVVGWFMFTMISTEAARVSNTPAPEFWTDRPLSSKANDKLNRAAFADRAADVLRGLPKDTGIVVGIHGPWGDGKTTVLNLLRTDLEADDKTAVVEFNPWRFTDEGSMLAGFFRVLAAVIRAQSTTSEDITGWVRMTLPTPRPRRRSWWAW